MNYLAHLYLSKDRPEVMVGNLLADWVRRPRELPAQFMLGVKLHWAIDEFTDQHEIVVHSRQILQEEYGRYSWVLVDVIYDHCLARAWEEYSERSLEVFARGVYQALRDHWEHIPTDLHWIIERMEDQNWLVSYRNLYAVRRAFRRLAQRASRPVELEEAVEVVEQRYEEFAQDFAGFFPQLIAAVDNFFDMEGGGEGI